MSSRSEAAGSMAVAGPPVGQGWRAMVLAVARVLLPVLLALVVGALVLLALGKDPLAYYGYVLNRGLLTWSGLQETITRMAPLLMISAGLIVAFRAGVWNLGVDGQFLLAAVITAALAPALIGRLPWAVTIVVCFLAASAVGALWSVIPALLKDAVTTPAGCTIDGLLTLEEGGLRVTLIKAVVESTRRAGQLVAGG